MSDKKILLITGGNTGLGYEVVRALCASSQVYEILLGSRSPDKGTKAVQSLQAEFPNTPSHLSTVQIDIEDQTSVETLFNDVKSKYGKLDILVNNAGAAFDAQLEEGKMTMLEMWNKSWNLNVACTHFMTHTFAPLLLESSDPRLLFIASGTSCLAFHDNQSMLMNKVPPPGWPKKIPTMGNMPAYRSSKAGMNMMMREWYKMLQMDGVKVWAVSPGYLATGLGGDQARNKANGALDPAIGGNFVKDVVEGLRDEDVGKVVHRQGIQPW